ncbi:RAF-like serine/threonine-protein kinase PRAF [Aristolochia californica]|uniref:RAF-like serine/threonine-protein kinase PRAF n=1 Tax=Aristolochia californica TaxID=171875 RepID=UPI0035E1D673
MAIDENLIPKDLRPLNVNRTVAGDDEPRVSANVGTRGSRLVYYPPPTAAIFSYASLGFVNPVPSGTVAMWASRPIPPPTISVAVAGPADVPNLVSSSPELPIDEVAEDRDVSFGKKVKFLCSFGGKILPRPSDGALRYVGGQTRIISVRRDIGFQELLQKMVDIYGHPIVIKYQLPDEDLDVLVSVSGKEDLDNMLEEYEKLVESSSVGSAKLRVFLFSALELDSPGVPQFDDFGDTSQRCVVAVNGIGEGPVGIRKKESTASASSTTHSEVPASVGEVADSGFTAVQGDDESLHATNITSHEGTTTRLMFLGPNTVMPVNLPPISTATGPHQIGSAPRPEPESVAPSTAYLKPYTDPHQIDYAHNTSQFVYANSQTFGNPPPLWVTGPVYRENIAGVPPSHPLLQAVHLGSAPSSPRAGLKQNADQQFVQHVDTYVGDSPHGATRLVQRPTEQSYKILQPHIQPSAPLTGTPVEQYLWHPVTPSEQMVRLDDRYTCQKALPHPHSDTLLQDQASGLAKTISEPPESFQSHHTEECMRPQSQCRVFVTGAIVDGATDQQDKGSKIGFEGVGTHPRIMRHIDPAAHEVAGNPQLGYFAYSQVSVPPGVRGFPGDGQAYGILVGNNVLHAHNEDTATAATNVPLQTSEALVRDYTTKYSVKPAGFSPKEGVYDQCFYYEHVMPVDSRLEALHLGIPDINGQVRSHIQPSNGFSKDLKPDNVPLGIESGNRMTEQFHVSNANPSTFVKPAIIPDVNYIKPIEAMSISSEFSTGLQNFEPVESNTLAHVSGNPGLPPQLKVDVGPSVSNEMWHGKPMFSCTESTFVAADQIPRKNYGDATSAAVSTPFSASNVCIAPVLVVNNQDTASTNTLFSSQDPWNLIQQAQQAHFSPPRPVRVASKEALVQKDAGSDNRFSNNSGESNSGAGLDAGALHQTVDTNWSNKGSAEELIKQDLKNVAEVVAASILQPSLQFGSIPLNLEENLPVESVEEIEFSHNGDEVQKQDVKTKFVEKSNPSLLFTGDIGRLQIIKNNDLEELRELGSGTFGTIYHGKWRGTDVAIKRINDRCFAGKPSEQERLRADFRNEACKLADLHHPNVVAFYGVVLDGPGGTVATVTEYMVNGSLRSALQRNDRILDRRKQLLIAMDVAFGMEYLHGKNIVHFDLKSDNLLVNLRDPQHPICKVGDLGLSKVKCQTLISGGVRGTLPWMAPELLNGSSSLVSDKVDVFSFGIVMWELLTGEEPFADLHYGAIIGGIVSNTLRPPVPESCDPEWKSLMEKCWAAEPSERPSFKEIACKLRSMAAALPPKGQAQHASNPAQSQPQK